MTRNRFSLPAIEHAIRDVYSILATSSKVHWKKNSEDNLWRELVCCILGSRVRYETVYAAVDRMYVFNLLKSPRSDSEFNELERNTAEALSTVYPFFRVRAKHIRRAAEHIYKSKGSIKNYLNNAIDVRSARRLLATEVAGLGPKQASLFLRNIGFTKSIAVLDSHVLTYLSWVGFVESPLKSVSSVGKYESLEESFVNHSYSLGCSPDRFDLAVWVVMKVVREESDKWG